MSSFTVYGVPGRTYHIAVFAVNAVGTGAISNTVVTGEMIYINIDCITALYVLLIQFHCFSQSHQPLQQLVVS